MLTSQGLDPDDTGRIQRIREGVNLVTTAIIENEQRQKTVDMIKEGGAPRIIIIDKLADETMRRSRRIIRIRIIRMIRKHEE